MWPRESRFPQRDGSDPTLSPPFSAGGLLGFRSAHLDDEDDVDADHGDAGDVDADDVDDVDADDGDGSGNSGFPGHSDGGCGDEAKSGPCKLSLSRPTENCRGFSSPSPTEDVGIDPTIIVIVMVNIFIIFDVMIIICSRDHRRDVETLKQVGLFATPSRRR